MLIEKLPWEGKYRWSKGFPWARGKWVDGKLLGLLYGPYYRNLSLVNGTAFFELVGVDLTPYVGTEGTLTPYKVTIRDKFGRTAVGYIGAAGGGETLGAAAGVNLGFETAGAGGDDVFETWIEGKSDGAIAAETTIIHGGSKAAKLTCGATVTFARCRMYQAFTSVTAGTAYKLTFWSYGDGTNYPTWSIYDVTNAVWTLNPTGISVASAAASWAQTTAYFVVPSGCTSFRLYFHAPAVNGGIAYFDDVTMAPVTDCAATGVHIVSAENGSTHNWASITTGFGYNSAGTPGYSINYRIEIVRI